LLDCGYLKKIAKMNLCREIYDLVCANLDEILSLRNTAVFKEDNTPVSKGDLLCQKLIADYIQKHLDSCLIISEEIQNDVDHISDYEYVVTIDPIDGTENFISGMPEWGFGVSIYKDMKHFQSIIALPQMGICLCSGDKIERHEGSRIVALSSHIVPDEVSSIKDGEQCRVTGCSMYSMYCVITGSFKRYIHFYGSYSWDILPGLNIALGIGMRVTLEGKPYKGEFLLPNVRYQFCVEK